MNKYIAILIVLFNVSAFSFENKYLSCTLTMKEKSSLKKEVFTGNPINSEIEHISQRQAKSKGLYNVPVQISETEIIAPDITLNQNHTNSFEGKSKIGYYDIFSGLLGTPEYNKIYVGRDYKILKNQYRQYIGDETINVIEHYECSFREKTLKEKAKEFKNSLF